MQSLKTLLTRWAHEDVGALPGVERSAVEAMFAELGAVATADVVHLYAAIGGMEKMDDQYWRHWPLTEIRSENTTSSPFGILFADYLVSSWAYRVKEVTRDVSCVYVDFFNGKAPELVANSLEEFFDLYLADPDSALYGPPPQSR